jgi:hypothetical protein
MMIATPPEIERCAMTVDLPTCCRGSRDTAKMELWSNGFFIHPACRQLISNWNSPTEGWLSGAALLHHEGYQAIVRLW